MVKGSAATIPETMHASAKALMGTPVAFEIRMSGEGSQPSHAMAYGMRETYSNWLLNIDHAETTPIVATAMASQFPAIRRAMAGHPADSLQIAGLVLAPIPATTGRTYAARIRP